MIKENSKAPGFGLEDQDGKTVSLADFGGKWVVLYFYPKDNTPGCTIEAVSFTRLAADFEKSGAVVLGVSKDSCESHRKFISDHNLNVKLFSDPEHSVQEKYGVWREKKFMGKTFMGTVRSTFLISPEGIVRKVWDDVNANGHAEEVLEALQSFC